ncbi:MAG TPA: hypothetical protein VML55_16630 [Planctomycetaceae bacterium]|nr:hypothetical protein [Planctomycetaceae bacterium]
MATATATNSATGKTELEGRVAELERQVRQLRELVEQQQLRKPWLDTFGMFADYDDFPEVVRLGREYRDRQNQASLE